MFCLDDRRYGGHVILRVVAPLLTVKDHRSQNAVLVLALATSEAELTFDVHLRVGTKSMTSDRFDSASGVKCGVAKR